MTVLAKSKLPQDEQAMKLQVTKTASIDASSVTKKQNKTLLCAQIANIMRSKVVLSIW